MNRRHFLRLFAAVPAVAAIPAIAKYIEPKEKLKFGKIDTVRLVETPKSAGNRLMTSNEVTREALKVLNKQRKSNKILVKNKVTIRRLVNYG